MHFLVIEGNIGVGKSTLARMISKDYGAYPVLEKFADNPFLAKFYSDKEEYALPLELSFMVDRYTQMMNDLKNADRAHSLVVADYYFMKSLIFAGITLANDIYDLYERIFNIVYSQIPKPSLYVYLHRSADDLLAQIAQRGREYEKSIDREYLESITNAYFSFLEKQTEFPVLMVDAGNLDFVADETIYNELCRLIFKTKYQNGLTNIAL